MNNNSSIIHKRMSRNTEVEATGCIGVDSYRDYARKLRYKYIEVVDWTSSAGDWCFIISKDGKEWVILNQTNNYPRPGFSHVIDFTSCYEGTARQVLNHIYYGVGDTY